MSILARKFFPKTAHLSHLIASIVLIGLLPDASVLAAEAQNLDCLPDWIAEPLDVPPNPNTQQKPKSTLEANQLTQPDALTYEVTGKVRLKQPGLVVLSDFARIQRQTQQANLWGQVVIYSEDVMFTAESAELNQTAKTAQAQQVQYQFMDSRAHGRAQALTLDQTQERIQLSDASYTTCRLNPYEWQVRAHQADSRQASGEKLDWELDFSDLDINNLERRIYGYNTLLYFQTVPIFYTPYISFPMDERASGLLFPVFGSRQPLGQDTPESYFALPYYINLAPNADDTLTLIKMQDRGWVVDNELRYLNPYGQIDLTLTGLNDQLTQRDGLASINSSGIVSYGESQAERWRGKLVTTQNWGHGLSGDVLWHEVSDKLFFNDIPVETTLRNLTQTERHVNLNFTQGHFNGQLSLLSYLQLRQDAAYNYEKRPELTLNYADSLPEQLETFSYDLTAQTTEFEIPLEGHTKPEGRRSLLKPSLRYDTQRSYGRLSAQAVANKVHYNLQNTAYNTTGTEELDITVPQFAVHGGLVFERDFSLANRNWVQTLEPEVQYLYVPYQDQSNIPLFDTAAQSLDFSNLFSLNRFSGYDRIGDTNQVSAALTTKFFTEQGEPVAEAGLGQIFYLADRQVQLSGNTVDTDRVSDYFVKLGSTLGPLTLYSTSQYNKDNYELTNANNRLKLDFTPRFKLLLTNAVTNYNQAGEKETLAAGINWQINSRWTLGSYWNYDFTLEQKTEVQHALRYDSCCWASELSVQETQLTNGLYNYSIQYVIELKGLSSVGTTFTDYLNNKLNF
ncbi:LPS-assembly protein LptD [Thiosulfativibrio zosterae]|uniref:LPS-assembly protein LptD n=1 Tax=Thiosulfativibrio zosterae TaxID=2675053 RepID=A0A6F8PLM3_9GAMM|nr:LPS assembly protein LptD [Thiosulfativibrio zosterae]BBP43011.1 LPS-assembly protein LptD [Thiosulfativibrio zosterae]